MADTDTDTVDTDAGTNEVTVTVPVAEPDEAPAVPADTTTVVVSGEHGVAPESVSELLDTRERLVRAELENSELVARIEAMETAAAVNSAVTQAVIENVDTLEAHIESVEDNAELLEDDVPPTREHAFWRTRSAS